MSVIDAIIAKKLCGGGSGGSGLTTAQINALDGMFKVCAFTKDNVSAEYTAFKTAFGIADSGGGDGNPDKPITPDVTLTSISATYSGGDVAVGTAVADLTGIVVTAHYSDGSSATVTGYTLSGEIVEGNNTVTVSYGGKTTTFVVTGVAGSGGDDGINLVWIDGKTIFNGLIDNPDKSTTEPVDVSGFSTLTITTDYISWFTVPGCYDANTFARIKNNENANYMGGTYPMLITFDVSEKTSIRIVVDITRKDNIVVKGE